MRFTTPCFIRKNTEELRSKLEDLGYNLAYGRCIDCSCLATSAFHGLYMSISEEMYDSTNPYITYNCANRKDCGTNEELFLAISALRNDSNYMQWFICTEDYIESTDKEWKVGDWDLNTCPDVIYKQNLSHWRKATVEELINHFK